MRFVQVVPVLATLGGVAAQRPKDTPICDYYTTALFKNNTAENQYTLLTALVNTVVIGNYTQPNVGVSVPGILAKGTFDGTEVNLLPYFDGTHKSTNRGGNQGVSVNFLDGGGAEPLKKNKPADDEKSHQYFLLTHLYQFFGSLLGCTEQGMPGFDSYTGAASMFQVHRFMDLGPAELGYFVQQVALAASSFGVAEDDIKAVGTALNTLFGMRCAPPATAIKSQGNQLQAICVDKSCPLAMDAMCSKYDNPDNGGGTGSSASSMSMSMTVAPTGTTVALTSTAATATDSVSTGGAAATGLGLSGVAAFGFAALLL
ncbi:hypothetical protein B0J18DRAFT_470595 [Chaetomium sp. MPI-SDFR-AT-0129]|nr:hypothetical protein B0J18DRAFT_470595 [Chaetomium sp. MPI-SDFR-AT-0129]